MDASLTQPGRAGARGLPGPRKADRVKDNAGECASHPGASLNATISFSPLQGLKTNENMKPVGSWAGKQVLTWSPRALRKPCFKEVRRLGKARQGQRPPVAWELGRVQRCSVESLQVGWTTAVGPSLPSSHKRVDDCAGLPGSDPKTSPNS